jgi:hypothetical protein
MGLAGVAMTDKRELINLRLIAIFGSVDGMTPAKVYRDRGEFDEKKTIPPIMVYLDGTERKVLDANSGRRDNARGGVPAVVPMLMEMSPQIYLIMQPKKLDQAAEYGPEISDWRMKVLKAVMKDASLLALLGANGSIDYRGMETDMQAGRSMEGQLQFNFAFRYILNPSDL